MDSDRFKIGDVVTGKVKRIESYGAFLEIGNSEQALLHISEISNDYIKEINDHLMINDEIEVMIIKNENNKINVSRKQLLDKQISPLWKSDEFDEKFYKGNVIEVERFIKEYTNSILVEISSNIIAMIEKSSIPDSVINFDKYFENNIIFAEITRIDKEHQKMSLRFIDKSEYEDINAKESKFNEDNNILYLDYWKNADNLSEHFLYIKNSNPNFFPNREFNNSTESKDIVDYYFKQIFNENIPTQLFFSNTSMKEGKLDITIRQNLQAKPLLVEKFPENHTIGFRGHLFPSHSSSPVFIIDRVFLTATYEKKKFEIERKTIPILSDEKVYPEDSERENNIFEQDFIDSLPPISRISYKKLKEWEEYLDWLQKYAEQNLIGFRYFHKNLIDNKLIFHAIVNGEDDLKKLIQFSKRGEFEIYESNYSTDKYRFNYRDPFDKEKYRSKYSKHIKVGEFVKYSILGNNFQIKYNDRSFSKEPIDIEFLQRNDYKVEIDESKFENPIIVELQFKISSDNQEELEEFENETLVEDFWERIFNQYFEEGFIASSAIATFVQIRRQRNALNQVIMGNSYAPFLSSWLFDIRNAELPKEKIEINKWLNNNLNSDQKSAVTKMLSVPNIGLIQGPPGTGKTTVIAEIIYQLAIQGKKVLLSSQTNLAVDNALDRLAENPKIRAIRLGKTDKLSEEGKQFSETFILKNFYRNIANNCKKKHLKEYYDLTKNMQKLAEIKNEFHLLNIKQKEKNDQINQIRNEIVNQNKKYKVEDNRITQLREQNDRNRKYVISLNAFIESLISSKSIENRISLPDDLLDSITEIVIKQMEGFEEYYLNFYSSGLLKKTEESSERTKMILDQISKLFLIENQLIPRLKSDLLKLEGSDLGSIDQYKNDQLEKKLENIENKLDIVADGSREERQLVKEIKVIRKKIRELKTSNLISSDFYKKWFNKKVEDEHQGLGKLLSKLPFYNNTISGYQVLLKLENENKPELIEFLRNIIQLAEKINFKNLKNDLISECKTYEKKLIIINIDEKTLNQLNAKIHRLNSDLKEAEESKAKLNDKIKKIKTDLINIWKFDLSKEKDIEKFLENQIDYINYKIENNLSNDNIVREILEYWCEKLNKTETIDNDSEYILERYLENCNVVGITCNENPRIIHNKGFNNFDVAIIDEVSKATPSELLFPMSIAKKVILVGDHRQLPPVFSFSQERSIQEEFEQTEESGEQNNLLTKRNFERFKKMVTASLFKDYFEMADDSIKQSLFTQFRMHTQIMDVINFFYENRLIQGISNPDKERNHNLFIDAVDGTSFIKPERHAIWIDSSKDQYGKVNLEEQSGTSRINQLEINIIYKLLEKLNEELLKQGFNKKNRKDVGVISFYGRQVGLLKRKIGFWQKRLKTFEALKIDVNSVDRFQGKENSIVIVSMVRNKKINPKYKKIKRGRDVSFVAQFERINVAFSRAQELLLIVGAKDMFFDYEVKLPKIDSEGETIRTVYKDIIGYLDSKACFFFADTVLERKDRK